MENVEVSLDESGKGTFTQKVDGNQIGKMDFSINEKELTVRHTEVDDEWEGKGYGKKLIDAMVDYARKNNLKVIPLCPFVKAQFSRHPEEYGEVWKPQ